MVVPLLVILGWRAHRGHLRAQLVWLGCLAFTVYNYAIYAFFVQFAPLFPVLVAVLGLALYALLGGLATRDVATVGARTALRDAGDATVAAQLSWLALACLPILITPVVAQARGHEAGWAATGPIGLSS